MHEVFTKGRPGRDGAPENWKGLAKDRMSPLGLRRPSNGSTEQVKLSPAASGLGTLAAPGVVFPVFPHPLLQSTYIFTRVQACSLTQLVPRKQNRAKTVGAHASPGTLRNAEVVKKP